jgi:hypothetical protein
VQVAVDVSGKALKARGGSSSLGALIAEVALMEGALQARTAQGRGGAAGREKSGGAAAGSTDAAAAAAQQECPVCRCGLSGIGSPLSLKRDAAAVCVMM